MEYVFEDFIFGFIDKELDTVRAKSQRSDTWLDEGKTFRLRPDLWIKTVEKSFIADTKYKIVYSDASDPKKGISQADLYQMLAYAIRFKVDEVILFYPETIKESQEKETELAIRDALADGKEILIKAFQLPIMNKSLLEGELNMKMDLTGLFETVKWELKNRLEEILITSGNYSTSQK
jgi:5-methylcytosine-specific restriction enzyme subunit McrC